MIVTAHAIKNTMDVNQESSNNYQVMHKFYCRIKKLSKIENDDSNAAKVKKEINDLIDCTIEKINTMTTEKEVNGQQCLRLLAMKITMYYERSKLLISLGDEKLSQETLITALNMTNDVVSKPEIIYLAFRIINHYAYLLSKQCDYETSRSILEYAEKIYNDAKTSTDSIKFFGSDDLFAPENFIVPAPETSNKLERLVTNNLQMLAFIYNKQELHDKFAEYHHEVLRRQLECNDEDVTMWAIKSARLASYFFSKNRFKEASHHLSAAIHVLEEYKNQVKTTVTSYESTKTWQDLQQKFAEVAKCWVKYGLYLFSVSKSSMVTQFCGEPNQMLEKIWQVPFKRQVDGASFAEENNTGGQQECTSLSRACTSGTMPKLLEESQPINDKTNPDQYHGALLIFESLNLKEDDIQLAAGYYPVETTVQARALFLHTHSWLKRVKSFYTLNEYPLEYVNAILDLSELYRYLAFYEEDIESQYAVQKLRADALETLSIVLREVRPQCYMAVSVELLRELAEVQLEMIGLNLRRIYSAQDGANEDGDVMLRKMEALAALHSRLNQFNDIFGHDDKFAVYPIPETNETKDISQFVVS